MRDHGERTAARTIGRKGEQDGGFGFSARTAARCMTMAGSTLLMEIGRRSCQSTPVGMTGWVSNMTALERIEQAEMLSRSGDARAVEFATEVLGMEDATSLLARPRAHRLLALNAWSTGDLREARRHFGNLSDLLSTQDAVSKAVLAEAIGEVALADYYLGEHDTALTLRRQALELAAEQDDTSPALLRQFKRRLAQSLQRAGKMEEAARYYLAARPEPTDGPEEHIGWINAMALFNEQDGRIREAADWYAELAAFLSGAEDAEGAVAALGNAALFALEIDRIGLAAEQLSAMRRRMRTDRKLASQLAQYDVRMLLLQMRGRHLAAADLAARAERLVREHAPGDPSLASRVGFVASNLRQAGQSGVALDLLERHAPTDATATVADTALLVELATSRRHAGMAVAARQALTLALAAELGMPGMEAKFQVLAGLAELAADAGRPQAAALLGKMSLAHLRQSALSLAGGELSGWLRSRMGLYDQVLTQLTVAGRLPEAQWLQLRRWQEVSWEFGLRNGTIADPETVPFRPGEERLRWALGAIEENATAGSGEGNAQTLREVIRWLDTVWAEGFEGAEAVPARLPGMPTREPLVSYLPKGRGFVGVLERDGGQSEFEVGLPAEDIARAVRELRNALQEREASWRPASEALYRALIEPIAAGLAGVPRIDFALSGVMSFIPFATLSADDRFLVEVADIAVRTARPVKQASGLAATFSKAAAFGMSGNEDQPLAFAPGEAINLSERAGGELFLDRDFTAEALRDALSRGVELLHLAGHFRYEPARPHRSALILGDGSELTLATLAGPDYDFSTLKLLVLAACETAVSDSLDIGLEGLAGLAQAKGARTVLATLWRIGDSSAAHLMRLFYDNLFADETRDPVVALGQAQRTMLQERQDGSSPRPGLGSKAAGGWHPADWGGFTAFVAR